MTVWTMNLCRRLVINALVDLPLERTAKEIRTAVIMKMLGTHEGMVRGRTSSDSGNAMNSSALSNLDS